MREPEMARPLSRVGQLHDLVSLQNPSRHRARRQNQLKCQVGMLSSGLPPYSLSAGEFRIEIGSILIYDLIHVIPYTPNHQGADLLGQPKLYRFQRLARGPETYRRLPSTFGVAGGRRSDQIPVIAEVVCPMNAIWPGAFSGAAAWPRSLRCKVYRFRFRTSVRLIGHISWSESRRCSD